MTFSHIPPVHYVMTSPTALETLRVIIKLICHVFTSFTTDQRRSLTASEDDLIESSDAAQPLAQRLPDASVSHVTGKLAEGRVECWLERQEGGV